MIWITGCNGMLGSEVCRMLKQNNIEFLATGSEVDISDYSVLENFVSSRSKPDFVINCAAYTAVDLAEDEREKAFAINKTGVENLAKICSRYNSSLIHISTDYVFDGKGTVPYSETDSVNPQTVYGESKLAGEQAIIQLAGSESVPALKYYILRTSWLYGFEGKNFVKTMISLMNSKPSLNVVNDQRGTPTCCTTLSSVILKFLDKNIPSGIYHVSDGDTSINGISWFDFACKIYQAGRKFNLIHSECSINPCDSSQFPQKAHRPAFSVMDKSKLQKQLGITLEKWDVVLSDFVEKLSLNSF